MPALDLTPVFDELLVKGDSKPTKKHAFDVANTNGFLKEAYRISTHINTLSKQLGDVRQAYLSSAPSRRSYASHSHKHNHNHNHNHHGEPKLGVDERDLFLSDAQRDDIDANAKRLLRDLNASIKGLAEAETLHQETQQILIRKKHGFGGAARLAGLLTSKSREQAAAEDAQKQMAAHHESVLWYLRQRLQACGQLQQTMMEARLARIKLESTAAAAASAAAAAAATAAITSKAYVRSSSSSSSSSLSASSSLPAAAPIPTASQTTMAAFQQEEDQMAAAAGSGDGGDMMAVGGPSLEQAQLFESGNQDMVQHYATTLGKVRSAEQSLVEIAELQTMLVSNLEIQSAHVDQMVQDSFSTADNVAKGNQELKKALNRPSTARYTFFAACGLSLFVVVWDILI